jgi:TolB-like protein
MKFISQFIAVLCLLAFANQSVHANASDTLYPTAIFDFGEKSKHLEGMGERVSAIVFANLAASPGISLVEREELQTLHDEAVLSLSGMVSSQQAIAIGQLTGAKIIVTGTVFEIEDTLMLVAKIIGTETSRVLSATAKGKVNGSILSLTEELSEKIAATIAANGGSLLAEPVSKKDRLSALKKQLQAYSKPSLTINISERHVNRPTTDPAAQTEMILYGIESGFPVIDNPGSQTRHADIVISGEGFTELATRRGDIVGVKARLEVKAVDQATNRILAVDRQTVIELDTSELIAGKKALESASALIAERLLPKIVANWKH